jgi:protein TonB
MFEQSILANANRTKRFWSTCLGVAGECMVVAFVVVAPMLWPQVLPRALTSVGIYLPTVPAPPAELKTVTHVVPQHATAAPHVFHVPTSMPAHPAPIVDPIPEPENGPAVAGSVQMGSRPGVVGSALLADIISSARPAPHYDAPPPPPVAPDTPKAPGQPTRIRVSSVEPGKLLNYVKPVYPPLAKAARISGTVELEALIGTDGRLKEIRIKTGNPLLAPAAVDAVKQWVYQPTILNGDPVEVITTVLVTFTLNQ